MISPLDFNLFFIFNGYLYSFEIILSLTISYSIRYFALSYLTISFPFQPHSWLQWSLFTFIPLSHPVPSRPYFCPLSGHLLPMDIPLEALEIFNRFLQGKSFNDVTLPSDGNLNLLWFLWFLSWFHTIYANIDVMFYSSNMYLHGNCHRNYWLLITLNWYIMIKKCNPSFYIISYLICGTNYPWMVESYRKSRNYMMGISNEDSAGAFLGNFFLPAMLLVLMGLTGIAVIAVRRYKKYVYWISVFMAFFYLLPFFFFC